MLALRALCRSVVLDPRVNVDEIRAMWSFVTGTEFLIAFNRLGMQHMIGEIVYGLICIQGMLFSSSFSPAAAGAETRLHRLVHDMLCKLSDVALNFSRRHISLSFPCTLYHVLLEEAKDPVKFSGNHGLLLLRMLDKAKKATPAEWMSAASPEGGDKEEGNVGWMRPIAAQADFHVARWTRPHDGECSQPSDEDPVVQASLSRAIAAHQFLYPDIAAGDDFWRLGVLESGIAMYARLHPRSMRSSHVDQGPFVLFNSTAAAVIETFRRCL